MSKNFVPGLSIALIKDANLVWSQGFGVKSAVAKEPITAETVFEAASFEQAGLRLCGAEAV